MRSESEIVKDIEYLKQDIVQLRSMRGIRTVVWEDLEDLYMELRLAKQSKASLEEYGS